MSDTRNSGTPDGAQPTEITQSDTALEDQNLPDAHPGVEDGAILETATATGVDREKVVYDFDEDGNQVGWHKEPVK